MSFITVKVTGHQMVLELLILLDLSKQQSGEIETLHDNFDRLYNT